MVQFHIPFYIISVVIPLINSQLLYEFENEIIFELSEMINCIKPLRIHVYLENPEFDHQEELFKIISKCNFPFYTNSLKEVVKFNKQQEVRKEIADALHVIEINKFNKNAISEKLQIIHPKQLELFKQKFLIYLNNKTEINPMIIRDFVSLLWEKKIVNVIFVTNKNHGNITIQTYFPFSPDGMKIQTLNNDDCLSYYQDKITNLHGAEITNVMFLDQVRAIPVQNNRKYVGLDGNLSKFFADDLNATMRIIGPTDKRAYGYKSKNGTVIGAFAEIYNENADFGLNSRLILVSYHKGLIEYSKSYERHDLCFLVPKAEELPVFYNLFRTFTAETWIVSIAMMIPVIITFLILQQCQEYAVKKLTIHNDIDKHYTLKDIIIFLIQSLFGDSLVQLPRRWSSKMFIMGWLLYSFFLLNAFSGKLISSLVLPKLNDDIDTLDDLFSKTSYPIFGTEQLLNSFKESLSPEQFAIFIKRFEPGNFEENIAKLGNASFKFALARKPYFGKHSVNSNINPITGRSLYHIMKEPVIPSLHAYLFQPGSPYIEKFNNLLLRLYDSGFMEYWEKKSLFQARVNGRIKTNEDELKENEIKKQLEIREVLAIEHFESVFAIWAVGILIGGIIFTLKLMTQCTKNRRVVCELK